MNKKTGGIIPSNSYPYGAAAAVNIASTSDISDTGGKWCLVIILYIVSFVLSIWAYRVWEWASFCWGLSIALTIDFAWGSYNSKSKKFNCADCGYLKCADRGERRQLKFCTWWFPKPIQHFRLILWTCFFGILTLIFFISNDFAARVFILIFWVPGLSIVGVLWIDRLKYSSTPHAYHSMPNHSPSCRCRGTGSCPNCSSTLKSWNYTGAYYTTSYGSRCAACKGTKLCPAELEKVAPELLQNRNDLIFYGFMFVIFGYVIFGLLLDYIYVYGGFI